MRVITQQIQCVLLHINSTEQQTVKLHMAEFEGKRPPTNPPSASTLFGSQPNLSLTNLDQRDDYILDKLSMLPGWDACSFPCPKCRLPCRFGGKEAWPNKN